MSTYAVHIKKYKMFAADAANDEVSTPTRIVALFEAIFHLIEAVAAKSRIHINKHSLTRSLLEANPMLFGERTEDIWRAFQQIENQIRPGQAYGGAINGEALRRTKALASTIEHVCKEVLKI